MAMNYWRLAKTGAARASMLALLIAAVSGCGQESTPSAAPVPEAAVPAAGPPASQNAPELVSTLQASNSAEGVTWTFVEGVGVELAEGPAPLAGWKPLTMTATATAGMHRIGQQRDIAEGSKTYDVTVWVKGSPGVDALIELAGAQGTDGNFANYGVAYFDLEGGKLAENAIMTPEKRLPKSAIAVDGEWKKLSGELKTSGGKIYLTIGMVAEDNHVFTGKADQQLVVGGISLKPH